MRTTEARAALAQQDFGGGNAWRTALRTSPAPGLPVLVADRPIVNAEGVEQGSFSLEELVALADAWSAWYRERGVGPRDRVVVHIEDTFEDQVHLTALAQLGAIPVLLNGLMVPEYVLALVERCAPVGIYTDETRLARLEPALKSVDGLRWIHTRRTAGRLDGQPLPENALFRHAADDPVVLCHTSGTTGVPKLVVWTHRQSIAGARFRLETHPEPADSVMLSAIAASHSGAIAFTFYAVLAGLPFVSLSDRSPEGLARAVRTHRPTIVQAFHPVHSALANSRPAPEDFASVREWMNTGDSAHDAHIRELIALGHHLEDGRPVPGSAFRDGLGASELGWAALGRTITAESPARPRHLGRPVPLADVTVLREDGTPAEDGEVGLLALRSPSLSPGYWNDCDTYHRGRLGDYRLSGDLVHRTADGDFFHVDRLVDRIRTDAGDGYSVLMEEILLLALPEAADCAVVAGRDDGTVVPVAVVRRRDGDSTPPATLLERANAALAERDQPPLAVLDLAAKDADIPTGPTGKVLKRQLRERYADLRGHLATRDAAAFAIR
ncbi:class I adenylate-forming enzyme family protein [Streptomyces sp. AV19]|uniref:class I adenylate-forming enzyme family protein n=1 Tax=Streptomyces sp. AV19 TaxID=2793068 RepID=UPI001F43FB3C|nr:class I adenylate-forming enzyme family protein [Streptomyces sp. AV19]MDG4534745.1 acyl--CoA ligase [Streptomyces sp. AV19]